MVGSVDCHKKCQGGSGKVLSVGVGVFIGEGRS